MIARRGGSGWETVRGISGVRGWLEGRGGVHIDVMVEHTVIWDEPRGTEGREAI